MVRRLRSLTTLLVLVCGLAEANEITNGGFDVDLAGWTWSGVVGQDAGEARIGDDGSVSGYSLLFQPVAGAGRYDLSFDFRNDLSPDDRNGTSPLDSFYATLYLTNDLGSLDIPTGIYDDALVLFNLDAVNGVFDLAGGARIDASPKGSGWQHFSLTLHSSYAFLIPAFELSDFNFVGDDSRVFVDNVSLVGVVPAPAPLALMALGVVLFWCGRWGPWRPGHHP